MAKWSPNLLLVITILSSIPRDTLLENLEYCRLHRSPLAGIQLTCRNIQTSFRKNLIEPLNGTHWVKCQDCILEILREEDFEFPDRNNVSVLDLSGSKIRRISKDAFRKFFLLKVLILRDNCIEGIDPKGFFHINRLTQLDLSQNFLDILGNNLFAQLTNLDILNLNHNHIFYIQPEAFSGLDNLKHLYLSNNQLKQLEARTFKRVPNLSILYLEHNQIEELHQNSFQNLTRLLLLYLNNNSITYLVQYNFKPLVSLVDLQLRHNNLTEIETGTFNGLTNLRSLYLGHNHINLIKPYGLIGLETLEILDLSNNLFTHINYFHYFSSLTNLRYLFLQNNTINNLTVGYKYEVPSSLTFLNIDYNDLSGFDYSALYKRLDGLMEVSLVGNRWGCEFFNALYIFFGKVNVSICANENCTNDSYLESICRVSNSSDDEMDESLDFSTSSGIHYFTHITVLVICVIFF